MAAKPVKVNCSISPTGGGSVSGTGYYDLHETFRLTAFPSTGYKVKNWKDENGNVIGTGTYITASRDAMGVYNFTLTFEKINYTITLSDEPSGSSTLSGARTYASGSTATISCTPNANYRFVKWLDDRLQEVSTNASYTFTVSKTTSFTAILEELSPTIVHIEIRPSSGGSVTGEGTYRHTDLIVVTATPNSGYDFTGWYDSNDVLLNTNPTYRPSHTGDDLYLIAKFTPTSPGPTPTPVGVYTVVTTSNPANGGSTSGGGNYASDSGFTIQATPNAGYRFDGWYTLDNTLLTTNRSYSGNGNVGDELSYVAYFTYVGSVPTPYTPSTNIDGLPSDIITDIKPTNWMMHGDTGMYCIFVPNDYGLSQISRYLYSSDFFDIVIGLQKAAGIDLTQIIINFCVIPLPIPTVGYKQIKMGWFPLHTEALTELNINYTNTNYVELDCGTLYVNGVYNSAFDYQTTCEIYLPFIGYKPLETYDVIGHNIRPVYQVDLLTNDCVCKIYIDGSIKYQFNGSCGYSIPVSQVNMNGIISKGIGAAILASEVAGVIPPTITSSSTQVTKPGRVKSVSTKGDDGSIKTVTTRAKDVTTTTITKPVVDIRDEIGKFTNMGGGITKGGSLSSNTGYLSVGYPFLNIARPRIDIPEDFGKYNGYPCNKKLSLGNITGFTVVGDIQLTDMTCTADEKEEIENLLKGGVIL